MRAMRRFLSWLLRPSPERVAERLRAEGLCCCGMCLGAEMRWGGGRCPEHRRLQMRCDCS